MEIGQGPPALQLKEEEQNMSKNEYTPVVFELPDGTEISNDPVWLARKKLEEYEAANPPKPDEDMPDEFEELTAKELKAKAAELGVDIEGLTKASQVREALRKHVADEKAAAEAEATEQTGQ